MVIEFLFNRFHYDGVKDFTPDYYRPYQSTKMQILKEVLRRNMTEQFFGKFMDQINDLKFPEEILSEDEKCSMYFLISHTINQTRNRFV